jgi:hypothetical protein
MDGHRCTDTRFITHEELHYWRPANIVAMHTAILTRRKGGRIAAMVYLVTDDSGQLVARIKKLPQCDPNADFYIEGGLPLSGPGVHPLPITDKTPVR